MRALFVRILWVSLTTSAVLLPALLLEKPLSRRYRPKSCYLLWLLLCLRLLIPVEIPLPRPAVTVKVPRLELPAIRAMTGSEAALPQTAVPAGTAGLTVDLLVLAGLIWAAGVLLVLLIQIALSIRAKRKLWNTSAERAEDVCVLAELGGHVPVRRCAVASPVTMGLLRPVILLPADLAQEDVPMALHHELCHLKRRDIWYKALFFLCACVHWFNPLVWRLNRVAGAHLELCCDQDVVAGQDERFRREYGQLLLRSAAMERPPPLTTQLGGSDLKGRLMNLFITKKRGGAVVCIIACAALLLSSLVACQTGSAASYSDKDSVQVGRNDELTGYEVTLPEVETGHIAVPAMSDRWVWPVAGTPTVSAPYTGSAGRIHPLIGEKHYHSGMDIVAPEGAAVLAANTGVASQVGFDPQYGNYVLVDHPDGRSTLYAHLKEVHVESGTVVAAGHTLGLVGQTGAATGVHLHFEVRQADVTQDPADLYPEVKIFGKVNA